MALPFLWLPPHHCIFISMMNSTKLEFHKKFTFSRFLVISKQKQKSPALAKKYMHLTQPRHNLVSGGNIQTHLFQGFVTDDEGKSTVNAWPVWIEVTSQVSHLLLVFNSSVNFFIYLGKHWTNVCVRHSPDESPVAAAVVHGRRGNHRNHQASRKWKGLT